MDDIQEHIVRLTFINSFHSTIKFTSDYSHQQVNFLDVTVRKEHGFSLQTYTPSPQTHTSISILQAAIPSLQVWNCLQSSTCLRRICSNNSSFIRHTDALEKHLMPGAIVPEGKSPLTTTTFSSLQIDSNEPSLKNPSSPTDDTNLRDLLVRAAVPPLTSNPTPIQHGTFKCDRTSRCISAATTLLNPIPSPATACNSHTRLRVTSLAQPPYVIYLISCRVCGIQYVGETKTTLKKRFYGHRSTVNTMKTETPVGEHLTFPTIPLTTCPYRGLNP
ncbi:hypothetical protein BSL78_05382 [Apostichopus japonicus]|uniref:GIY-YIG domain-containing protein n=1 Tax=Stichopus japonicus TaxID=307972 RepID=A0A2G8LBQ0_STIJA|nr:hypothetical protein BSL78_05382 [Apostichopus japonicus]